MDYVRRILSSDPSELLLPATRDWGLGGRGAHCNAMQYNAMRCKTTRDCPGNGHGSAASEA